jgi:Zn-dependent oligopeptidase
MHIFSGGYAASYYSYMWSEVLEADLFSRFREAGIFDRETGREYMDIILSAGDRAEPDLLFRKFMGRDPDPEALIARNLGELAAR